MNVYLDSSAFVKLLAGEAGWQEADRILAGARNVVASTLVFAEVGAALAAMRRAGRLTARSFEAAADRARAEWAGMHGVEVKWPIARAAAVLADRHALRAADAVHLATALAVNDPRLVMVTWDARLHAAARGAGLAVAPAEP